SNSTASASSARRWATTGSEAGASVPKSSRMLRPTASPSGASQPIPSPSDHVIRRCASVVQMRAGIWRASAPSPPRFSREATGRIGADSRALSFMDASRSFGLLAGDEDLVRAQRVDERFFRLGHLERVPHGRVDLEVDVYGPAAEVHPQVLTLREVHDAFDLARGRGFPGYHSRLHH